MTFNVVGIGEVLWDLLRAGPQLGGAPVNYACHAAALGARATAVTRIGNDALGRQVSDRFKLMRLPLETVQLDSDRPTGTVTVTLDDQGVPNYVFAENCAWDHLTVTTGALQAVRDAHAVCFGTLSQRSAGSRDAVQQMVAAAPANALRIFDVNLRLDLYTREVIDESLQLSSVLKLNDDELTVMTSIFDLQGDTRQRIGRLARAFDLKVVALTGGASGSLIFQEGQWSQLRPHQVHVIDTVGAGDSFSAALTMGLLAEMTLADAHAIANEVASYVCTRPGATPPLPARLRNKLQ